MTKGETDEHLARMTIRTSEEALPWMEAHGVRFQPSLSGTLSLSRTNAFFLGGGKALVNAYYRQAEALGVTVIYDTQITHVHLEGDRVTAMDLTAGEATRKRTDAQRRFSRQADFRATSTGLRAPGARRRATS